MMFKASKRTLTAAAVIAAATPASSAHARSYLNPSPRGVTIVLGQAQSASPVVRSNPDQQMPPTSDFGQVPAGRATGLGLAARGGHARSGESRRAQAPGSVAGLAALNHEQAQAAKALASNLVGQNHPAGASRPTAIRAPVVGTTDGGFDWGDGAIGALAVLGSLAAGFGATVLARRRTNSAARTES
jgi:hypothetical protein